MMTVVNHAKQPFLFPFSQMREAREALETRDTACKFFSFFFSIFFSSMPLRVSGTSLAVFKCQ